jgi:CheY-like chemotaxis protein/two-component sensor histidine kinase
MTDERNNLSPELQRMAILGELLAGMAHEINNLMVGVLGYADLELQQGRGEESRHNLTQILECGRGVRELTQNLLHFARSPDPAASGSIEEAVTSTLSLFQQRTSGVRVVPEIGSHAPGVTVPTGDLRLILANLLKNALDAMEGSPSPAARVSSRVETDSVVLDVWNAGSAIPADILPQLFTPFFTTKPAGRGTGLGLSVARRLVTRVGGEISARNLDTGGVVFSVRLPLAAVTSPEQPAAPRAAAPRLEGRRVLVVDDEDAVREVTRLLVSQMGGGTVETCSSGEDALKVVENQNFDAIVLDLRMSGISGQEVYSSLSRKLQRRVVFVTGDTLGDATKGFLEGTRQPALFKPVSCAELLEAVQKVATG